MAAAELRVLQRFPPRFSPLDVLVVTSELDSILRDDSEPRTVLFVPQEPQRPGGAAILLRLQETTEEEAAAAAAGGAEQPAAGGRVRLFASRLLLRHHGLRTRCTGTVRPLRPVSLERLVVGARSRRSLRGARSQRFTAGLLELCGPGEELLLRRGEPLLLGGGEGQLSDLLVLECSPVTQGQLTATTSLVLSDCSDWEPSGPAHPGLAPPSRPLHLCASDFALYAHGLGGGRSLLDSRKLLAAELSGVLQALECRVDARVVDGGRLEAGLGDVDVDGCLLLSRRLLRRLGLFNQEWVKLSLASTRGSRERPAAVTVLDATTEEELSTDNDTALISETLWFNLRGGDQASVDCCSLRVKRCPADLRGRGSDSSCGSAPPPFTSELHIQPVASPLYDDLGCFDDVLATHFTTPRVVAVGDVLTVPTGSHRPLLAGHSNHRCAALFFRVQKVCSPAGREDDDGGGGGAHLADRLHTSLYMGTPTNSPVPGCSPVAAAWSPASPPGLQATVELLSSIMAPHLQQLSGRSHGGCGHVSSDVPALCGCSGALSGCTVLLHGPAGSGKVAALVAASHRLHLHLLKVDCVSVCADTPAAAEAKLVAQFERAASLQPCVLLLRNLQLLLRPHGGGGEGGRIQAALLQLLSGAAARVVVVATACRPRELPAGITAAFIHQVALESPSEAQRHAMLVSLSQDLQLGRDLDLERLAKTTAGMVLGDLSALLVQAGRAACRRLTSTSGGGWEEELCCSGVTIQNQDMASALEMLQNAQSKAIGAPKIPDVRWEDVGGLWQVKKEILDTVQLPLQRPELLALGLKRTGVLLYGPPGTGKTLLAKAVATECSMTFLSVKGPELINMYVGQSEENIREVFRRAGSAAPCVVFFDELDSLAPSRGRSGDSGGVMDRVVSQLLAELDALHSSASVFVIGATNRPDLLDPSLLRPGRFDKLVYVGINEDRRSQLQVLQAVLRKFQLDVALDLQQVVARCPAHMSGADLYALCSDAMTAAVKRKILLIDSGLDSEDSPVRLSEEDFCSALENFRPSVSEAELLRYKDLRHRLTAE